MDSAGICRFCSSKKEKESFYQYASSRDDDDAEHHRHHHHRRYHLYHVENKREANNLIKTLAIKRDEIR